MSVPYFSLCKINFVIVCSATDLLSMVGSYMLQKTFWAVKNQAATGANVQNKGMKEVMLHQRVLV